MSVDAPGFQLGGSMKQNEVIPALTYRARSEATSCDALAFDYLSVWILAHVAVVNKVLMQVLLVCMNIAWVTPWSKANVAPYLVVGEHVPILQLVLISGVDL